MSRIVTSIRAVALGFAIQLLFTPVHADQPPFRMWVDLKVGQCQAVTFEAPRQETGTYRKGDKYRTTLIIGKVIDAKAEPFDRSNERARAWASSRTPQRGDQLKLVLKQWDESVCQKLIGKVQRFSYNYGCDTLPLTGPCLPPHQLVELQ